MRVFEREVGSEITERFRELQEQLEPALIKFLQNKRLEFRPLTTQILVLGHDEDAAEPWIVVNCPKNAMRKVHKFLQEDLIKNMCHGPPSCRVRFKAAVGGPLIPSESDNIDEVYIENDNQDVEGVPGRQIRIMQSEIPHYATLGGFVYVLDAEGKRTCYGLTAGHVLPKDSFYRQDDGIKCDYGEDDDNEDEDEEDSCSDWSFRSDHEYNVSSSTSGLSPHRTPHSINHISEGSEHSQPNRVWEEFGSMSKVSYSSRARDRDWALVEMKLPSRFQVVTNNSTVNANEPARPSLNQTALVGNRSKLPCRISAIPARALLPSGRKFVDVNVIHLNDGRVVQEGSSGSWIIDEEQTGSAKVFGTLVATDSIGDLWMVPMIDILQDIKEGLDALEVSLANHAEIASIESVTVVDDLLEVALVKDMVEPSITEDATDPLSHSSAVTTITSTTPHLGSSASHTKGQRDDDPISNDSQSKVPRHKNRSVENSSAWSSRSTAPGSQPRKRVTRSSTTKDVAVKLQSTDSTTPKSEDWKPTSTTTKAKIQEKSKETSNATAAKDLKDKGTKASTKSQAKPADNAKSANFESLSISSDLIKNPVQCHSYFAPTRSPTLIFTHGAGGDCSAAAVVNFCTGYSTNFPILAFQGSMNLGARVKGFHACIEHLGSGEKSFVLGGRSMGARAAVMAASELLGKDGKKEVALILASYPLQGPKDVRDQILLDLPANVRVLFVIGDRDAMCPLELLYGVRKKMKAKNQLVVVKSADHGMHVKPAKMEKGIGEQTGRVTAEWVAGKVKNDVTYIGDDE
ncbi:hypothetical protein DE146DRAFT_726156 [Phaeosphaeria sp. MPI-PUGE-AT-0046c]|nr:hypothetical protein DE146DRAFT_726156 [Phaeosphaeria sp. MPI-PUGE-AT-0046c]